jgi:hypothetical protein
MAAMTSVFHRSATEDEYGADVRGCRVDANRLAASTMWLECAPRGYYDGLFLSNPRLWAGLRVGNGSSGCGGASRYDRMRISMGFGGGDDNKLYFGGDAPAYGAWVQTDSSDNDFAGLKVSGGLTIAAMRSQSPASHVVQAHMAKGSDDFSYPVCFQSDASSQSWVDVQCDNPAYMHASIGASRVRIVGGKANFSNGVDTSQNLGVVFKTGSGSNSGVTALDLTELTTVNNRLIVEDGALPSGAKVTGTPGVDFARYSKNTACPTPATTTSSTPQPMGLANGAAPFIPHVSGKVRITVTGYAKTSAAGSDVTLALRGGQGSWPIGVAGTAVSGSATSNDLKIGDANNTPIGLQTLVTGLALNDPYWADPHVKVAGGATATPDGVCLTMQEVP